MKTQLVNNSTILILLSKEDLSLLGVTTKDLNFSDEDTRAMLMCLLDWAQEMLNFTLPAKGKTVVEVIPFENGECLISYSDTGIKKVKFKIVARIKKSDDKVYCFDDKESMDCFIQACKNIPFESFEKDGKYRLILKNADKKTVFLANEFGTKLTYALAAAYTREHFNEVAV